MGARFSDRAPFSTKSVCLVCCCQRSASSPLMACPNAPAYRTSMTQPKTITNRIRRRKTTMRVKLADVAARVLITAAGIGTIMAIGTVCFFLASVVLPLFTGGEMVEGEQTPILGLEADGVPVRSEADEYGVMGWTYFSDGRLVVYRLDTGKVLKTVNMFADSPPTCQSFLLRGGDAIFGFEDGTVRLANISFQTRFLDVSEVEQRHRDLEVGQVTDFGEGMLELTPLGQFRVQEVVVAINDSIELAKSAVRGVDMISLPSGGVMMTGLSEDKTLYVNGIRETRNILTGKTTFRLSGGSLRLSDEVTGERGPAEYVMFEGRGDSVTLVWPDGYVIRLDTRDMNNLRFAETFELIDDGAQITSLEYMIGKMTIVVGDSRGRISTWFRVKPTGVMSTNDGLTVVDRRSVYAPVLDRLRPVELGELPESVLDTKHLMVVPTPDASVMVRQHIIASDYEVPVTSIAVSKRRRTVAAGLENGHALLYHVTSDQVLADSLVFPGGEPVRAITMGAKDDYIVFSAVDTMTRWSIDFPHPAATWSAIFGKVWYEGFERPEHAWQSTSGSDEFEPKYGLVPLIFGTLKATLYTMLIGVPLALLAAIYSSEFLNPKTKAKFKPTIEIMASLPSVVLGFLAALVFAPLVENYVPQALASFVTIPLAILAAAFVWQLMRQHLVVRYRFLRLPLMFLMLPVGLALGFVIGPLAEGWLFGGNIMGWLAWSPDPVNPAANAESPYRHGFGGWMLLMMPISALLTAFLISRFINPMLGSRFHGGSRLTMGLTHLIKFIIAVVMVVLMALVISMGLSAMGFDPRGPVVGTYIQRNALIVGFVMGFAVIPIIYTLAEDALSAVPEHLRAASLGAGATRWQTATTIIIPTAMSGLFSAVMIGLGRAVGETMIVLMAAGNTAIMELNVFSGFRTLSANIAVEMPEAVQNGTNFRMLFLAALTLFAMTFVVNTLAEVVRLRFRKRAYAL